MRLGDKQKEFTLHLAKLIVFAYEQGCKLTLGRGAVSNEANEADGGHARSLHLSKLAQDLNLFIDGDYITGDHPQWYILSDYWLSLHPENAWGGDWNDFNHFSRSHNGMK